MQPRRAVWTMPLVHSSHSCTICRQPRSPRRAFPPWTHTPAYCCAPSGHGRRGASTARARYLSHSANTQPNPSPAAQPLASRVGVTGRGPGSPSGGQRHQNPLGVAEGGGCRSSASTPGRVRGKRRRRRAAGEAPGSVTRRGGA